MYLFTLVGALSEFLDNRDELLQVCPCYAKSYSSLYLHPQELVTILSKFFYYLGVTYWP